MKKKIAALVCLALATAGLIAASRPIPLSELESLQRLDKLGAKAPAHVVVVRDAFAKVNEQALGYLPTMAVLRAEDAVAGAALSIADTTTQAEAQLAASSTTAFVRDAALVVASPFSFLTASASAR